MHDKSVVQRVPGRRQIGCRWCLASIVAAIVADEVAGDPEDDIALQVLIVVHEDLGDHGFEAWLVAEHLQVRRTVGMTTLGAQQLPGWSMGRHGITGGLDRTEPEPPVLP